MSSTSAEIGVRIGGAVDPTELVCGVPPVIRQLRQLARLGVARVRVACAEPAGVARVDDAIRRFPVPASLPVTVELGAPAAGPGTLVLDATTIYARDALAASVASGQAPAPMVELRTRADLERARVALFAEIRKTIELDGVIAYYVIRPVARPIVRLLIDTRVSPNQVTIAAMLCGLAAAALATRGVASATLAAGLLYWIGSALDCMDGDLARLRLTSSKTGEWLDAIADETSTYALCAGLGLGLARSGHDPAWATIGVVTAAAGALALVPLYLTLHRRGLRIDTAQFPWFFLADAGAAGQRSTTGTLMFNLGYLIRRDVTVTVVAILLALDLGAVALLAVGSGAVVGVGLTTTHFLVTGLRRLRAG